METDPSPHYGLRTMLGLCLINTIAGITTLWGVVVVYVASYLHLYDHNANLSNLEMSFVVQCAYWGLGLGVGAVGYERWGGKVILTIGLGVTVGPLLTCSFLTSLCPFLGVYFMATGMGGCILCINSMWVSWQWYPHRKGLVTGCVMFCFGASSAVQGMLISYLMNPYNHSPDLKVSVGNQDEYLFSSGIARRLPMTLRVLAGLFAAIGLISLLLIKERPVSRVERKSIVNSLASDTPLSGNQQECPDLKTALKTSSIYVLFGYSFTAYCYSGFMIIQYKNYAMTYFRNDQLISLMGSIGFICNTLTRFFISLLMDYIDFRKVSIVLMSTQALLAVTIHWVVSIPMVYLVWVCVSFICFAAVLSPVTIVCGEIYGPRVGGTVFSIVSQGGNFIALVYIPLVQWVIKPYGFDLAFYILGAIAGLGLLLAVILKTKYTWKTSTLL